MVVDLVVDLSWFSRTDILSKDQSGVIVKFIRNNSRYIFEDPYRRSFFELERLSPKIKKKKSAGGRCRDRSAEGASGLPIGKIFPRDSMLFPGGVKTLSRLLLSHMLLVATLACILVGGLWVVQETRRFTADVAAMRERLLTTRKERMREKVDGAVAYLQFMRSQTEARTRLLLQERVDEAHRIATHLYQLHKDSKSQGELEFLVRESLRPARFNGGRGYYFATRLDGIEQLCAACTHLEQTDLLELRDTRGAYVIRDMIALVARDGEGFYSYTWGRPDKPGEDHIKLSFIKLFEPFQWFLGCGEYLDDVEADLQREALAWIQSIRYQGDGYVFAGDWNGVSLSGPAVGKNMYQATDRNGVKIVQEMIRAAQSGGGFVNYVMPKLEGQRPEPKISYAQGVPEWRWYVGTGLYIDDIEREIEEYRQRAKTALFGDIGKVLANMLLLWLGVFVLVALINRKTQKMFTTFAWFFSRGAREGREIPVSDMPVQEFRDLAEGANRMIAERRAAEQALRERTDELENYFSSSLDLLCIANTRFQFVRLNPQWQEVLGYDAGELVGRGYLDFVHPDDLEATQAASSAFGDKRKILNFSNRYKCQDGSYRWIEWRARRVGEFIYANARDITERKAAEEEREKLQGQLAQAQKMESVGRLAGGVAHDFNNMLGVILGYSDLILTRIGADGPLRSGLEEIRAAAQRSADLTRQLLAFARKQAVLPQVIDVNATVAGMLKMLKRLIGEDIELSWLPGENLAPVKIDPSQIDQILANLCINARDAIGGVGKVTIETDRVRFDEAACRQQPELVPGEYVLLAVSDNGCGIAAADIAHLFEPFYTTKEEGKGTGLGLASVYGAVRQNNGFIKVYSEPGAGSSFKIYLPRHKANEEAVLDEEAPVPGGSDTILLVEDEATMLEMTTLMLQRLGYLVLSAGSPEEALRLGREHPGSIDLLMTDVVMPRMNGRDLAEVLRMLRPGLATLFMSGYTANVMALHGVLDEGRCFLQKPFTLRDVAGKVREAMEEKRQPTGGDGQVKRAGEGERARQEGGESL